MLSLTKGLACVLTGVSREAFNMEVNAKDYGFEPTDTPRTDRSVQTLTTLFVGFSFCFFFGGDFGTWVCSIKRVIQLILIRLSKH